MDRRVMSSVHTLLCGSAPLGAHVTRQLKSKLKDLVVRQGALSLSFLSVAVFDMTAIGQCSNGTWKSMNSMEVQYS